MMNTVKLYNEEDIEIHDNGISIRDAFFDKKKIADAFNNLQVLGICVDEH